MSETKTKEKVEVLDVEIKEPRKKKVNRPTATPPAQAEDKGEMMGILQNISQGLGNLNERMDSFEGRIDDIETGGANKFKAEAKAEDIEVAKEIRKGIDPKISGIVDEMLGVDFGAEVKPLGDRPGFRFTVIVPNRLSDNVVDKRPKMKLDENGNRTSDYEKNKEGSVVFEEYTPEDRRSRILSSSDSYDAIKQHCEKIRGYIVAYFQKTQKPLPEFKVQ